MSKFKCGLHDEFIVDGSSSRYGCGHYNDNQRKKCEKCNVVLKSNENIHGKIFCQNDIVYFPRKDTGSVEKGIIVQINEFSSKTQDQMIQIRYFEKFYRLERHDEIISFNNVYKTIEDFPKTRQRKSPVDNSLIRGDSTNQTKALHSSVKTKNKTTAVCTIYCNIYYTKLYYIIFMIIYLSF